MPEDARISPMLVKGSDDETWQQWRERWQKFDNLAENVKDILQSAETDKVIWNISVKHNLNLNQTAFISRSVRLYFFGELPLEDFPKYFIDNIGVSREVAEDITHTLAKKIIKKQIKKKGVENLSIEKALEKYPKIKEQLLTDEPLRIAGQVRPRPGTVENWITDYRLAVGAGKHTAIERGNYLFHGVNTKRLSDQERRRVAIVLKSLDENVLLSIDPEEEKIIFPSESPDKRSLTGSSGASGSQTGRKKESFTASNNSVSGVSPEALRLQRSFADKVASGKLDLSTVKNLKNASPAGRKDSNVKGDKKRQPLGFVSFSSGQRLPTENDGGNEL